MAFSEELVTRLSHNQPKDTCCRLALLSAIVKIDGSIHLEAKNLKLELKIGNIAVARQVAREFKELFGLSTDISLRKVNVKGSTQSQVIISNEQLRPLLKKLEVLSDNKLNFGLPKTLLKRNCCKKYFIRGAFLAGGYLNESARDPHLEISSENGQLIRELSGLLAKRLIDNRMRSKSGYRSLYIKQASVIVSFLKSIEAYKEVLQFENAAIIKNLKNAANRLANAETANKNKVIKNAFRQIKEINSIENTIGLLNLPEGLREICTVRLEHPEASLKELGLKFDPPLAKSAVNHRLRRIREIAGQVDGADN